MPGLIVFRRRWSVGSDDLVVPAVFLLLVHAIWLVVLAVLYGMVKEDGRVTPCWVELSYHLIGYLVLLAGCLMMEATIAVVATRGTILDATPRASMQYLIYIRVVLFIAEVIWLVMGVAWLVNNYETCSSIAAREAILGIVICNWSVVVSVIITTWCTFDTAGRTWVKMKTYQRSMKDSASKFPYKKRSGNRNRNWRQRKVLRAYQDSWDHRCRLLFCCIGKQDRNSSSFSDIARLLSEFFRDLDVVPSDVVAGLVLLRRFQKDEQRRIVANNRNNVYQFLSGVPVTPRTRFLQLFTPEGRSDFTTIVHYMKFALAVYGWPMYLMTSSAKNALKLCSLLSCCWNCLNSDRSHPEVVEDNCCGCHAAGLLRMVPSEGVDLIYVTYHVSVGETPFFVALDHSRRAVVISIRGTLSMKDVITDLNAESDPLPMDTIRDDWLGHKGMVSAAEYLRKKIKDGNLLGRAFAFDIARGTSNYDLVLVGHSLGAGTAAILAILLKQEYPNLSCFAYSPPGGLLSMPAVEYTRNFITSVVVGKDVVPRIGLHQMEALRADLISAIQRSTEPKWKTIISSFRCCSDAVDDVENDVELDAWSSTRAKMRDQASHPSDSSIALTMHPPLYPPGRILHVVRNHPKRERLFWSNSKPVYQAIWVDNKNFDEVLISPCMIQDHLPDKVLEALEKVLETQGPLKPQRVRKDSLEMNLLLSHSSTTPALSVIPRENIHSSQSTPLISGAGTVPSSDSKFGRGLIPHKILLETSFTCSPVSSPSNKVDFRSQINIQGLTWEILSALEDQFLVGGAFTHALNEEFQAFAPLASPETLSETSSLASRMSTILRESSQNGLTFPSGLQSPGPSIKSTSHCTGTGYCFYANSLPLYERKVMKEESSFGSISNDEDDNETHGTTSPSCLITLEPITTKESACENSVEINFLNGDCHDDKGNSSYIYSDIRNSKIVEVCSQITSEEATPVPSITRSLSSSSIESGKGHAKITSSQLSRDSGYGERPNVASDKDMKNFPNAKWSIPQQEYGRPPPPEIPFYLYSCTSPEKSPSSPLSNNAFHSSVSPFVISSTTPQEEVSSQLQLAMPLLRSLQATTVSLKAAGSCYSPESSV